ncbi:uncharacterized protein LOC141596863 [Silene latifolia]|uniref:uncharacterized protein LOC141596863 n=1 Tax=Silene latifolia TaxID=37657 RepID=UPI003D76B49F
MSEAISNSYDETKNGPTIFMFVDHGKCRKMSYSAYIIEPANDMIDQVIHIDEEGFICDSEPISPAFTFKERNSILPHSGSVNLGSKIYFLGGRFDNPRFSSADEERLIYQAQVFDTDHPKLGMQSLPPMHSPKMTPCVFVADGMIYALGSLVFSLLKNSAVHRLMKFVPSGITTGLFERYDPSSNSWLVLPDPPLPIIEWKDANFVDCATVVDRRVFISSSVNLLVFNLDDLRWEDPIPHSELSVRFPYGLLFVKEYNSLYQLTGSGAWKLGTPYVPDVSFSEHPLKVIKRGPFATPLDISLLKYPCLDSGKEQVMAHSIDLDENMLFATPTYSIWRDLFHMGGRFFCYIVADELKVDRARSYEPYSRAVLIKFFEEVPAPTDNNIDKTEFRTLASFCYKINTNFYNPSSFIRCSVIGSVPDSWINAPPQKQRQESEPKHGNKEPDQSLVMKKEEPENKSEYIDYLKKCLAAREEQVSRLQAELMFLKTN